MPVQSTSERSSILRDHSRPRAWPRYCVAIMVFLGFAITYILRTTLSVTIVDMTVNRTLIENKTVKWRAEFNWNKKDQGMILGSFFIGYITSQIIGGYLARNFGGSKIFGLGILCTSVLTLFTPLAARNGKWSLICLRVAEGVFEGVIYPSSLEIWSVWASAKDRGRLVTIGFSGSYIGTVVGMAGTGFILSEMEWPAVFSITGITGIVWASLFLYFMKIMDKHHEEHPRLVEIERVPWRQLFTSAPVWAIFVAHFVENWGFYTMLTELPTFLHYAGYSGYQAEAGEASGLPYLVMALFVQVGGQLSDCLVKFRICTVTNVRKLVNGIGFFSQGLFLAIAGYLSHRGAAGNSGASTGSFVLIILGVGFGGFAWAGFSVNQLDLGPQYGSIIMGVSNTFATIPGILSPILTGAIVDAEPDGWVYVFSLASMFYFLGLIFYTTFASAEPLPWTQSISNGEMFQNEEEFPIMNNDDMKED